LINPARKFCARDVRILIVAGCKIAYTPVVKAYITYVQQNNCKIDVIEYKNFKRLSFIASAFSKAFRKQYTKIICIYNQSLPVLLILSWISSKPLVYWKLESHRLFDNWSIAVNLQLLEYLVKRNSVELIVPTRHRAIIQVPKFNSVGILPNAPIEPYIQNKTCSRLFNRAKINLVLYGTINNKEEVFLNEWVNFCEQSPDYYLTVIGENGTDTDKITWLGRLNHDCLIEKLCDYNKFTFSLVGYRATHQNNEFAAPNKLIESLACGLPVIGHVDNLYVAELIKQYQCGLLIDFTKIDTFTLDVTPEKYDELVLGALNAAHSLCLSTTVSSTAIRCV
jgi:glycosyltransferase involved in cell wall biosynthesis